jgi:hypothetical protein
LRPLNGFYNFFSIVGWGFLPLIIFGLFNKLASRLFLFLVLPVFTIWSFGFSYDIRGLYIIYPSISIIIAFGINSIIIRSQKSKFILVISFFYFLAIIFEIYPRLDLLQAKSIHLRYLSSHIINVIKISNEFLFFYFLFCILLIINLYYIYYSEFNLYKKYVVFLITLLISFFVLSSYLPHKLSDNYLMQRAIKNLNLVGYENVNTYLLDYFSKNEISEAKFIASSNPYLEALPVLSSHFVYTRCENFGFLTDPNIVYYLWMADCPQNTLSDFLRISKNSWIKVYGDGYFSFYKR